jgi:predicted ester cyclase
MYTQLFLEAFPDLHFDIKDVIAQGDKAAVSWVAKGTHTAPLKTPGGDPIPATNKKVTVPGSTIYEFRHNLIARQEIYWDQVAFLAQLELLGAVQSSRSGR